LNDRDNHLELAKRIAPHLVVKNHYWEYDSWNIYRDFDLFLELANALFALVKERIDTSFVLGGLGGSGTPLTLYLMQKVRESGNAMSWLSVSPPDVGILSRWGRSLKPNSNIKGKKVVLIDTDVKSGFTVYDGYKKITKKDGEVPFVFAFTDYVAYPEREFYNYVKANDVKIIRLFDFCPDPTKTQADLETRSRWFKKPKNGCLNGRTNSSQSKDSISP